MVLGPVLSPGGGAAREPTPDHAIKIDGRKIMVEGRDEVVLRCGRASITLTRDGRVAIRGVKLSSRASGSNKIKGGSVQIN